MTFQKPTFSKKKVAQKFNLEELFGVSFSGRPDLREEVGQALMDVMLDRTAEGKAIGGEKSLQRYSKEYKDSDAYADHRKTGKVNMELTGRMMDSIDMKTSTNEVEIFVGKGVDTKKAYNHNKGDTVPKRDFFGLQKREIADVKKQFSKDFAAIKKKSTKGTNNLAALLAAARQKEQDDTLIDFLGLGVFDGES